MTGEAELAANIAEASHFARYFAANPPASSTPHLYISALASWSTGSENLGFGISGVRCLLSGVWPFLVRTSNFHGYINLYLFWYVETPPFNISERIYLPLYSLLTVLDNLVC